MFNLCRSVAKLLYNLLLLFYDLISRLVGMMGDDVLKMVFIRKIVLYYILKIFQYHLLCI